MSGKIWVKSKQSSGPSLIWHARLQETRNTSKSKLSNHHNTDPPRQVFEGDTTFVTSIAGAKHKYNVGDTVDGAYKLTAFLGQGGMGVVFACTHNVLSNNYAIKILSSEDLNEEYWNRFRSEAQALAKLNHPNIVGIFNMGVDRGQFPYYVMDLLDGETLDQVIARRGRVPTAEALSIFIQVADALGSAHSQGIIHRDVKPSNLVLLRDAGGRFQSVKIVDFGIARLSKQNFGAQSQTKTGMVFGTPFYMSPEQCQGSRVDERSDIYSLGCALFEALTGKVPFCGDNSFQTFMMHQTAPPPCLMDAAPRGNFDDALELAVAKMLAKRPEERYQSMAQVKHDLERIREGKAIKAPGQAITISPAQSQNFGTRMQQQQRTRTPEPEAEEEQARNLKLPMLIAALLVISGIAAVGVWQYFGGLTSTRHVAAAKIADSEQPAEPTTDAANAVLEFPGTTSSDMGIMMDSNFTDFNMNEKKLTKLVSRYEKNPATAHFHFKQYTGPPHFQFPKNFYIACISIDGATPVLASGSMEVSNQSKVCLYLGNYTEDWHAMLDNFGSADLTGLEILTKEPDITIPKLASWTRLEHLSFFNSLVKALPRNEEKYDESVLHDSDLPAIDNMTRLKELGLCGPALNGRAIAQMRLLDTLHTLMLKRISNPEAVLSVLPAKDNIKEVWLVGMDTTNEQLEPLTRMKNLETLRIRRSKLKPDSLEYFKKMPKLKHLILDCEMTPAETRAFKDAISGYESEPVVSFKYWKMFPDPDDGGGKQDDPT
ncbi:MAG: serine/threonine protein kinase [Cyanobacteria bacterium SZAS LIN-3]|nr:serine/threonine protein kinase [Cyanobacteria bacterium SZAS LIN-3]